MIIRIKHEVDEEEKLPIHVQFVERFRKCYELKVGHPFKMDKLHFIMMNSLLNEYGPNVVTLKIKTFGVMCHNRSVWFVRDGWADFTIGKLSKFWNSIIPQVINTKEERDNMEAKEKWKKINESINRTVGT